MKRLGHTLNKTMPYCTIEDAGIVIDKCEKPSDKAALEKYLALFAKPVDRRSEDGRLHRFCLNCDEEFDAFKQMLGMGVAHRWGMVHGEASCSGCGWPSRGHHVIKDDAGADLCSLHNLFLQVHPNNVTSKKEKVA